MKTVIVGCQINIKNFCCLVLCGLFVSGCVSSTQESNGLNQLASAQENLAQVLNVKFIEISENKNFKVNEQDWHVSAGADFEIKVIQHEFADENTSLKYIFNRRMLLHKNYQNEIAPYFGVVQLNQECLQLVDTKGDVVQDNKDQYHIQLSFPAKEDYNLFDCSSDKFRAVLKYYFHYCKSNNKVYETRFSKKLNSKAEVNLKCQ